jgi:hypothetical protein
LQFAEHFHNCKRKFGDKVLFLIVYIEEAHPQDRWPLGRHVMVNAPQTMEDRILLAQKFVNDNSSYVDGTIPIVVDGIDNQFMKAFYCHPERFFVFNDNKLVFKAQPQGACYIATDLDDFLESILDK